MHGIIDNFRGLKVIVIGDAMLDSYLEGTSDRLCREAPVPVVSVQHRQNLPGGAANTAVNLRCLGSEVIFLSVIGDDQEGKLLQESLQQYDVPVHHLIVSPERATLAKQRVIAGSQMVVRFDQGSTQPVNESLEDQLIERMKQHYAECHAIIISDYEYGILSKRVIQAITRFQLENPCLIVVDSKRLHLYRDANITAVKPNYMEAIQLLALPQAKTSSDRATQIAAHTDEILNLTGAQIAAVTLDQEGAIVFERDHLPYRTYARPQPNSRSSGAGDTYISALTLALASGAETENAAEIAAAASSIVVGKEGTSACYTDELLSFFSSEEKLITDAFHLAARIASHRREGRKIVFTNGCFDILHSGHINYLNQAKMFGDILIVGLNSDESVRRLKGPTRPINTLEDRVQVLAALSSVDHIVPFDGDTPHELIRLIQPDVFVKGGDYSRANLPEADLVEELGGTIKILPYVKDHSTTNIIERIRNLDHASQAIDSHHQ
jgi:D-beta-D-heptose 7-phosphate kinase/D-beta-D-heptose 1-phosphate adenosyltransferase